MGISRTLAINSLIPGANEGDMETTHHHQDEMRKGADEAPIHAIHMASSKVAVAVAVTEARMDQATATSRAATSTLLPLVDKVDEKLVQRGFGGGGGNGGRGDFREHRA